MADSATRRPVLRFFAVVAGLSVLAWMVFLGGFWQVMSPAPESPDLGSRTLPTRTVAEGPEAMEAADPDGPFTASGRVTLADGSAVPDHPLMWTGPDTPDPIEVGRTDSTGRFTVDLPAPGSLAPQLETQPARVYISESRTDLAFVGLATCPLAVTVLDPGGSPVADQSVRSRVRVEGRDDQPYVHATTDASGVALLSDLPCGIVRVWVRRAGYPQGRRENIDNLVDQAITVQLVDGVAVTGWVSDPDGTAIPGARVSAGNASDHTDDDGTYGLLVDPRNLSRVDVSADGYSSTSERLRIAAADAADTELVLNFVLDPSRLVTVHCAGMPDDACTSIMPMFCTRVWLPMGDACRGTPTTCECPDGRAAVRGAGLAVEVEPDDTEVWLDLRGRGGITGRVTIGGQPVDPSLGRCQVIATRLPTALEDIPGGMSAGATASCLPDGHYALHGLKAGNYLVMVETAAGGGNHPSVRVDTELVDAGTLDIGGGGRIEGVVLDGTTGEGVPGQVVVAYAGTDDTLSGLGQTVSRGEGHFEISGLQDGRYDVMLASRPLHTVSVTVSDGAAEPLELETGDAGLLTSNGFELETDDAGQLVVRDVDPEGTAAAAGLLPGDAVVGVTIGGFDPGELLPGMADEITDAVLDHWDSAGVGLVVERDGERVEVPLE